MKQVSPHHFRSIACLCLASVLMLPCPAWPKTCERVMAQVISVEGRVEAQRAGERQWRAVQREEAFCPGDTIRVGNHSRAALSLVSQPLLRLDQNTTITLGGVEEKRGSIVDLARGAIHFFSRISRNLEVHTGFVNAGVEGTEGLIRVEEDRTLITIYDGRVLAANAAGSLAVTSGQSAEAEAGKAPVGRVEVRPRDAVNWALYYPPVMLFAPGEVPPEDLGNPRFLAYRASRLIAVGRVDAAGEDIRRALELDPQNSGALGLQAVVFVVQNQKQNALEAAREAVAADPDAPAAHLALSYAQQAAFDLQSALASVQKAVRLDPDDALAWARLAELQSSFGRLDKALNAAQKATELEPNLSRTQMVLGYAYLTQVKTGQALTAFNKAIALDQADPLSHLGLGLAKIREGNLDAGAREIEIAASLDPNNAIVRSYLGKTYYEQKRGQLDEREYQIAKELDPDDPTPYFYDAIAKQTTNRPVEALENYEKAIELNDNRAVYRSKLLLDSDEAAKQAALARVYSDLGFQQLALVEGWKSVNFDPTNYSAHRFLSDSYFARPRQEIARVSELLQSQLLQPINITPVQPRLSESNLFLLSSQGPTGISFNEFNPLFIRDRVAFQGSGILGENETSGGEGVVSGIYDKFSYSAGYTYFDTDGWRSNAYQRDKIVNIFAQYELTYKTSLQAEYRYRENKRGDVILNFFEQNDLPDIDVSDRTNTYRVGARHLFSPGSTLIGNFTYQDADNDLSDVIPLNFSGVSPPPVEDYFDVDVDQYAYSGELQHLFRSPYVNTVTGGGYFHVQQDFDFNHSVFWPVVDPPIFFGSSTRQAKFDINHYNVYFYSYIKPLDNLLLTVGASGDFYDSEDRESSDDLDEDKFNPKFGVAWNPLPDTTLRAAVFRTFKRTLITDQTLEPTQVAGFNQFFDDIDATETWVYGVGIDQKFPKNFYGGTEFFYRDMDVPMYQLTAAEASELNTYDWDEYIGRAYLNWTPHDWWALSLEYRYEKLTYDEDFNLKATQVKTQSVPLGINFFHPSGLGAGMTVTYWDQEGKFENFDNFSFKSADDCFWLVDANVRYRFPKRYGFITIGATNLFDENFEYFEVDSNNSRIQPERSFFATITIAFP